MIYYIRSQHKHVYKNPKNNLLDFIFDRRQVEISAIVLEHVWQGQSRYVLFTITNTIGLSFDHLKQLLLSRSVDGYKAIDILHYICVFLFSLSDLRTKVTAYLLIITCIGINTEMNFICINLKNKFIYICIYHMCVCVIIINKAIQILTTNQLIFNN